MQQLLLGPTALAALLCLATRTIYYRPHAKGDQPPVMYPGHLLRFAITDIHGWLDAKRIIGSTGAVPVARRRGQILKAQQIVQHRMGGAV